MASLSILAAVRSSGSCQGSFAGLQLLSALSCFVPVLLLVWRGLLGCFCFARKDFSAHLHPYLSLALEQEARYRQLLLQPMELGEALCKGHRVWGSGKALGTVLWGMDGQARSTLLTTLVLSSILPSGD